MSTQTQTQAQANAISVLGQLGGRKFLIALGTLITLVVHAQFPNANTDTVWAILGVAATYIFGQSYSDAMTNGATSSTTPISAPLDPSQDALANMVKALADAKHDGPTISGIVDKIV
jgi:hypothetical protein